MDSGSPAHPQHYHQHHPPPQPQTHHHHHHHHQQHHPQHQQMMVGSANSYPTHTSNNTVTIPTPSQPPSTTTMPTMMSQQQQIQTQNANSNSTHSQFPFNSVVGNSGSSAGGAVGPMMEYSDGSGSSPRAPAFSIEQPKKKRGRPRKYSPDGGGNIALALSPSPVTPISSIGGHGGDYSSGGGGGKTPASDNPAKRNRGRPPGSGKKQLDALGSAGVGFTPHVIMVNAGEDIASKLMAFAQQGPRTVSILSANGAICNVTLRQPATSSGTVTYEGRFEIISLSGSFQPSESRNKTGCLSVSLAGSDGRVLGGSVAGMLMAASPIQVIVGSFIADGKKPKKSKLSLTPSSNMLNFGAPVMGESPPSHGASCESSDDKSGSPPNRGPGPYSNAGQPIQSMPMYTNMGWASSAMKMHQN